MKQFWKRAIGAVVGLGLMFGAASSWVVAAESSVLAVQSAPTAVTVLPDGAWVTREIMLNLPREGSQAIMIGQLPAGLDRASVQVSGDQLDLTAPIEWRIESPEQTPAWDALLKQQTALDQRAGKAEDALLAAQVRLKVFQAHMESAERVGAHGKAAPAIAFLADPLAKSADGRMLTSLIEVQRDAKNELASVNTARADLLRQFEQIKQHPPMQAAVLTVARRHAGDAPLRLTLRYRVNDARWRPLYRADLRLPSAPEKSEGAAASAQAGSIHWVLAAEVSQHTGENWHAVPLTLALQDTRRYVPAPQLARWTIGFAPPVKEHTPLLSADAPRVQGAAPENDSLMRLENTSGFRAEFHSKQPITVLSQDAHSVGSVTIPLMQQTTAATPELLIAPPMQTQAVLTAEFTPDLSEALPPGQWQLFVAGEQVAEVQRPALLPKAKLRLSFGVDPKVQVDYHAAPKQREENGLIGKSTQLQRSFSVVLTSSHLRVVPVTVLMQLPVAVDAEISVEPLADATPPTSKQYQGVDGVWAWSNQLKPQQSVSIHFGYRLRWPADRTVYGLR